MEKTTLEWVIDHANKESREKAGVYMKLPNSSRLNPKHMRTLLIEMQEPYKKGFVCLYDLLRTEYKGDMKYPRHHINHLPLGSLQPKDRQRNLQALIQSGVPAATAEKWEWPVSFVNKHTFKIMQGDGELLLHASEIARMIKVPLSVEERIVPINRMVTYLVSASGMVSDLRIFEHAPRNRRVILREFKPASIVKGTEPCVGLDVQVIWEHPTALKTAA
jgi:hypothetical protein